MTTMMMTAKEVAEQLRVNVRTVWWLIRTGKLPAMYLGHRYVIPRQAVEEFVASACGKEYDHEADKAGTD